MANNKVLLSRKEVASRTGLSLRTITKLISTRKLKSTRVGRRRLVSVPELNRFIKRSHSTTKSKVRTRIPTKRRATVTKRKRLRSPAIRRSGKLPLPTLRPFKPPKTIKQYLNLSDRDQDIWDHAVQIPAVLRTKRQTFVSAARELTLPEDLAFRLIREALRKLPAGRIVPKKRDRLLRLIKIPSDRGFVEIFTNDSRAASRIGEYWNAVSLFLDKGDSSGIQSFEGEGITDITGAFHFFLTDLAELKRQGSFGTLRFEDMYGRTAR